MAIHTNPFTDIYAPIGSRCGRTSLAKIEVRVARVVLLLLTASEVKQATALEIDSGRLLLSASL